MSLEQDISRQTIERIRAEHNVSLGGEDFAIIEQEVKALFQSLGPVGQDVAAAKERLDREFDVSSELEDLDILCLNSVARRTAVDILKNHLQDRQ